MAQKLTKKTNRLLCNFLQTPRQVSYIYWSDITVRNQLKLGKNFCNTSKYFLTRIRGVRSPAKQLQLKEYYHGTRLISDQKQVTKTRLAYSAEWHSVAAYIRVLQKVVKKGGGALPYKTDGCDRHAFEGWKFVVWYPLGCQNLKLLPSEL